MRGIGIALLFGLMLWLFAKGALPLTILPAIGIWFLIKGARHDPVDEIFVGILFAGIIMLALAGLELIFSGA